MIATPANRRGAGAQPAAPRVLVVDDRQDAREALADVLRYEGREVHARASAAEALRALDQTPFDLIFTDLDMPGMSGLDFLRELERRRIDTPVVMITGHATVSTAVEAMKHGARDYLEKPFQFEQIEAAARRALRRDAAPPAAANADPASALIGESAALRELRARVAQAAPTDETVLIHGESGVGKEVVARLLHRQSRRAAAAMVCVNCPALPPQLLESELFGHERGAFTSADGPRLGRFEAANGGSLLLDEVTEIDPPVQAKLLRVLQERAFERVGSSDTRVVDVRVVATTNRDLRQEVAAGRFRADLYYRLAVVPLWVPPLRSRGDDVLLLAGHFLERAAARLNRPPARFSPAAEQLLLRHDWPGNVRELQNLCTRAMVLRTEEIIEPAAVADLLAGAAPAPTAATAAQTATAANTAFTGDAALADDAEASPVPSNLRLDEMERMVIEATLRRCQGNRARTADALGIGVRTLCNKLRAYGYAPRAPARPAGAS